ncbi:MAG TPA: hypothetical protein PKM88_03270 [bacterium]|nr:hypothetical protein [bacterium]
MARRRWVPLLGKLLFSVVLTLVLFEAGLRWCGGIMPSRVGNFLYSAYNDSPYGIFAYDELVPFKVMKKNFATRNYFNGYFFDHQTDRYGFRNPAGLDHPDILLLGDSFIFGHGVNEADTVRSFLSGMTGKAVYNLSVTGNGIREEYALLKTYLPVFRPQQVFLFTFLNDPYDLVANRPADDLARFPEQQLPFARLREYLLARRNPRYLLTERLCFASQLYRLSLYFASLSPSPAPRGNAADTPPAQTAVPASFMDFVASDSFGVVRPYFDRALTDLHQECRDSGVVFQVVNLPTGFCGETVNRSIRDRFCGMLSDICRLRDIRYLDLSEGYGFTERDFLEHDGHFRRAGHQRLARVLAAHCIPPARQP